MQALCRRARAVFILDEIITGFRWDLAGAQAVYGLEPDLSTFGKALGNGFSVSALVGRRELMELGGLRHEGERVFLLSTTFGAETMGLAVALEVMRIYREEGVIEHLYRAGRRLRTGLDEVARANDVRERFQARGRDCNLVYVTRDARARRPRRSGPCSCRRRSSAACWLHHSWSASPTATPRSTRRSRPSTAPWRSTAARSTTEWGGISAAGRSSPSCGRATRAPVQSAGSVSVVIPTFGRPALVARAAATALGQTVPPLEVLVVADGHDPRTREVVEGLADQRCRYLELPVHRGAGAARNLGVAEARGDLVAFLDDDDEWLPHQARATARGARLRLAGASHRRLQGRRSHASS